MGGSISSERSYDDPLTALALLFVGLLSLCLAILYPIRPLLDGSSASNLLSGVIFTIPMESLIVAGGLLVVSAAATTYGLVLLFLRL